MAKKMTAFERWKEKRRVENADTEELYVNPLELKLGDSITIDTESLRDEMLKVDEFRVVSKEVGEQSFPSTDYFVSYRDEESGEVVRDVVLRFTPLDSPDKDADITHQVLLLEPLTQFEYDPELAAVLEKNEGFVWREESMQAPLHTIQEVLSEDYKPEGSKTVVEETHYPYRVGDVVSPYYCTIDYLKDKDSDGELDRDEVDSYSVKLWDFCREAEDGIEYLFVEIDNKDGWTEIYTGREIDQEVVTKI
jgi:hypothetical protein